MKNTKIQLRATALIVLTVICLAVSFLSVTPPAEAAINVQIQSANYENFAGGNITWFEVTVYSSDQNVDTFLFNGTHTKVGETITPLPYTGRGYAYPLSGDARSINYIVGSNVTRKIVPLTGESLTLILPQESAIMNAYTFNIMDLASTSWGYVEYSLKCNATSFPIERQSIKDLSPPTFYMSWGKTYQMKLICDLGTIDLPDFTAGSTTTSTITISSDMFYTPPSDRNTIIFNATKNSDGNVEIQFYNPFADTQNVTFLIYKQGFADPVLNDTYFSQDSITIIFGYPEHTVYSARMNLNSTLFGNIKRTITLPYDATIQSEHPFALLRILGKLPFDPANIPAMAILIVIALAIGWWHLPWGIILEILVTAILVYIGWLPLTWSWVGTVAAIGFLLAFSEQKNRETG